MQNYGCLDPTRVGYFALKDKTTEMLEKDWEKINRPVCGTI